MVCNKQAVLFWNVYKALRKTLKQKYTKLMSFVVLAKIQLQKAIFYLASFIVYMPMFLCKNQKCYLCD